MYYNKGVGSVLKIQIQMFDRGICAVKELQNGGIKLSMNPINKPAAPAVGWQQARVLEMQAEYADAFDTQTGSYDEMCAAYGEERKMWNSGGPEMEETIEYQIPYEGYTVPVRLLRPVKAEKLPVIFFMHGGGFVEGDNDTHGLVQRKLAAYSGCVVIGIDYFLVPEVRYPVAIEECVAVCKYVNTINLHLHIEKTIWFPLMY